MENLRKNHVNGMLPSATQKETMAMMTAITAMTIVDLRKRVKQFNEGLSAAALPYSINNPDLAKIRANVDALGLKLIESITYRVVPKEESGIVMDLIQTKSVHNLGFLVDRLSVKHTEDGKCHYEVLDEASKTIDEANNNG